MDNEYNLLDGIDRMYLLDIAQGLIQDAEFCMVYESGGFAFTSEEKQRQAFKYLTNEIFVTEVDPSGN